jgi:WD40 repeat protein
LPRELAQAQAQLLALPELIRQVQDGTHPELQRHWQVVQQAEQQLQQLKAALQATPLPTGLSVADAQTIFQTLQRDPEASLVGLYRLAGNVSRWAFAHWLKMAKSCVLAQRQYEQLRQQYLSYAHEQLQRLQQLLERLKEEVGRLQYRDLVQLLAGYRARIGTGSETLPVELWIQLGPELERRYIGWNAQTLLEQAERAWRATVQFLKQQRRRKRLRLALGLLILVLAFILGILAYAWPPSLQVSATQPDQPIAGEPWEVEFRTWSLWGRPVFVEWRYAGETEWQRLEEPKLRIPEIKADSLALEFRPVDSKGFLGNAIQQQVYVPVPTLKITKQEPPNGPIAGEPFTVEFEATSPVGRAVHVEWRYAGETQWQRLEEPKLRIPEVKGDSLVLEFRAVDSKGLGGSVVQGRWQVFVPTPTLKITKQDPPNGPIAGEPFTVEFEATSPLGRAVHVEWRYAGEARWQRLAEPKLGIPEVKGETLALEFRAVDTKDFASPANQGLLLVFANKDSYARREVRRFTGHESWVSSIAVTPDGKYVVSGSVDKTVRLWDLATGKEVLRFTGHADWVWSVAVTPDGKYVVSGSGDKTVRLWDLATGKEVRRLTGHEEPVMSVAVTPDGRYVVSGSRDKTVRLWDLATGQEVRRFTGHEGPVYSVAVTPDGKHVVSGSGDNTVRLWELATGKEVRRFTGHEDRVWSVAVTPDGKYVVSGSDDKTVRLWELATGKEVRRFTGHGGSVESVAVTPDGQYVVSGSWDNTVRLWELATGKEARRLTGHEASVYSVAVTPDGQYVVSGSKDNTVRVWYIGDLK